MDISKSAYKILCYTLGFTFEDFIADSKIVDAVIRNFEIIGEAANRLPEDFKVSNPMINWQKIRGSRNRIYITTSVLITQSYGKTKKRI